MFCPKCGTQNPENGKFCRSCGTDLSPVSEALAAGKTKGWGMIEPVQPMQVLDRRGRPATLENALVKIFMGLAFLIVSIFLALTGRASQWWFWMLIPAFGMLGSGIALYLQIKKSDQRSLPAVSEKDGTTKTFAPVSSESLPPAQTEYIAPSVATGGRYETGDLVPSSVVEGTTRHLEINQEGETMTLPQKK